MIKFKSLIKKLPYQATKAMTDLSTAGVIGGGIALWLGKEGVTPGLAVLLQLGIPALASVYGIGDRIIHEKIEAKDKEKMKSFLDELKSEMADRKLQDLNRFIGLEFNSEEYSVIEEIIKEGLNAKNKWIRKFASSILVTIGSNPGDHTHNAVQCLRILREIDDLDARLLLLHAYYSYPLVVGIEKTKLKEERKTLFEGILSDPLVYAQSIQISSQRLANVGLVMRGCSLYPYDQEQGNKKRMIEDFLAQNREENTVIFMNFLRYLKGKFNDR